MKSGGLKYDVATTHAPNSIYLIFNIQRLQICVKPKEKVGASSRAKAILFTR